MIIIQASNIHNGGGAVLLNELIGSISLRKINARIYVDARFKCSVHSDPAIQFFLISPTIVSRLKAEWCIRNDSMRYKDAKVLFFGNLPPLFKLTGQCLLFFQNVLMLSKNNKINFNLKTQVKQNIERFWLKVRISYVNTVVVQSESVKNIFLKDFPRVKVIVKPFSSGFENQINELGAADKEYDFIYVASSDPHKNHTHLLKAWRILSEIGLHPILLLVVSNISDELRHQIDEVKNAGGRISTQIDQDRKQIFQLYSKSRSLIYPSIAESFGLPLLEAQSLGLSIVASELDFVRDLVDPVETFDPNSPISIARAVQRFLKEEPLLRTTISSGSQFLESILKL